MLEGGKRDWGTFSAALGGPSEERPACSEPFKAKAAGTAAYRSKHPGPPQKAGPMPLALGQDKDTRSAISGVLAGASFRAI